MQSLVDVDSPHISSVPSDFSTQSIKTETQADRLEHEAEDAERREAAAERRARGGGSSSSSSGKHDKRKERAKQEAGNPVVLGNSVAIFALTAALGWGAYRKYRVGELSWGW